MKKLWELFLTFLKIGLFTFGGGYAMISLIEDECCQKRKFISSDELKEMVVLSEATPGPISIGCATFIGYRVSKLKGAIVSSIALLIPSLVIITLLSIFLSYVKDNPLIYTIFLSIRGAVILLMINALLKLSKGAKYGILFFALLIISFSLNFFLNISSVYIILGGLLLSIIYLLATKEKEEKKDA